MYRLISTLALFVCGLFLLGCNRDGAGLLAVKGSVNFEGKPLANGSILFELEDTANPHLSGAPIENGKFEIAQARGLKPGKYLVRISSAQARAKDENEVPGDPGEVAKEKIPPDWNSASKQKVEITSSATDLVFDIK